MLEFRKIELSDKEWIRKLLLYSDYNTTDYNFTVMYIWRHVIHTNVARYKNLLLVRFADATPNGGIHVLPSSEPRSGDVSKGSEITFNYLFPAGEEVDNGDLLEAVRIIFSDAKKYSANVAFVCMLPQQLEWLNNHKDQLRCQYTIESMRNSFDYIYDAKALISLSGKKYQSKRNFVNGFKRVNDWSLEPISHLNIEECKSMNEEWYRINSHISSPTFYTEKLSVEEAFANYFYLDLYGAALMVDGRVIGFTIGEIANSNTILIHIEKCYYDIRGAYQTLGNEFLKYVTQTLSKSNSDFQSESLLPPFAFVNREDDAGDEGLRMAKQEYHPLYLAEKFYVKFKE